LWLATLPSYLLHGLISDFNARLDFIRLESRKDQYRRQLFQQFEAFEHAMDEASEALYIEFLKTGKPGLAPGSNLRHKR
jgi:hypothetical protein